MTETDETPTEKKPGEAVAVEKQRTRAAIVVAVITAISGLSVAVVQAIISSSAISDLHANVDQKDEAVDGLSKTLHRVLADHLEEDLWRTAYKTAPQGMTKADVEKRRLKRAVFLNMSIANADTTVLQGALKLLVARGHEFAGTHADFIVAEFPQIRIDRRDWLLKTAIPLLENPPNPETPEIPASSNPHPNGQQQQMSGQQQRQQRQSQGIPPVPVPLPDSVRIIDFEADAPIISVTSLAALKREVELIDLALSRHDGDGEKNGT